MNDKYEPKDIEPKWQEVWEKDSLYTANDSSSKPKYYSLMEFPYPSGDGLHTGHVRGYTAMDIVSRKRRMEGFNVLYPIGWDAFGLPTENYAIKTGKDPRIVTKERTDIFRKQFKSLGMSFDWSREINTTDPKYYKWTQWIFLQFLKHDLAYKAKTEINWCPKDKIGLANEEVVGGLCERCGTPVEKREKEQWILRITKYADRLEKDLDELDYQERIKLSQKNWIGRSEGAEIEFPLNFRKNPKDNENRDADGNTAKIKIFTTRPDTIFGATYLVLAPEHLWITLAIDENHDALENKNEIKKYVQGVKNKTDIERTSEGKEKSGIEVKGVVAINPATGEEIPIWVADYVLPNYGTGAIMAVPAHDQRDYDFATKFNLPIKEVVVPNIIDERNPPVSGKVFIERKNVHPIVFNPKTNKYLALKWKKFDWVTFPMGGIDENETIEEAARREVKEETGYKNLKLIQIIPGTVRAEYFAAHKDQNRIALTNAAVFELIDDEQDVTSEEEKDTFDIIWLERSQLNYTNMTHAEIEIWNSRIESSSSVFTDNGVLINSKEFNGLPSDEAKNKITQFVGGKLVTRFKLRDWIFSRQRYWGEPIPVIHCDKCGTVPVPEKDLPVELPHVTKYEPTDTGESPLANITEWINVSCPKCGGEGKRETDVMPNWAGSSWYFLRYTDPHNDGEFASSEKLKYWMPVDWYNGGMEHTTLHLLYSRFWNKFLFDIGLVPTTEPYLKRTSHGLILAEGGEKMSKSKGNVINPDDIVERFGADTLRLYEMFMGPFDQAIAWSEDSLVGPRRFIEKIWKMSTKITDSQRMINEISLNQTIKKVSEDIEGMKFNTAISAMMMYANELDKEENIIKKEFETLLLLLSPFAPHVCEELWHRMGNKESIALAKWPTFDEKKVQNSEVNIAIQINGKTRSILKAKSDLPDDEIKSLALSLPEIGKWLVKKPQKVIIVPNKVVNIVL
jgi:leucyl-tRNA synthetase